MSLSELPIEIIQDILKYLPRQDAKSLRRANKALESKISPTFFRSVVIPFNSELQNMVKRDQQRRTERQAITLGKRPRRSSDEDALGSDGATSLPWLKEGSRQSKDLYLGHGYKVFEGFGRHIRHFGMSFEVKEADLTKSRPKRLLDQHQSYFGSYRWPAPNQRFDNLATLEETACDRHLFDAMSHLTGVQALGLSLDDGHGCHDWRLNDDPKKTRRRPKMFDAINKTYQLTQSDRDPESAPASPLRSDTGSEETMSPGPDPADVGRSGHPDTGSTQRRRRRADDTVPHAFQRPQEAYNHWFGNFANGLRVPPSDVTSPSSGPRRGTGVSPATGPPDLRAHMVNGTTIPEQRENVAHASGPADLRLYTADRSTASSDRSSSFHEQGGFDAAEYMRWVSVHAQARVLFASNRRPSSLLDDAEQQTPDRSRLDLSNMTGGLQAVGSELDHGDNDEDVVGDDWSPLDRHTAQQVNQTANSASVQRAPSDDDEERLSLFRLEELTHTQAEWLLEASWAQRAFLESYMLSVMDNQTIFAKVKYFNLAFLSSRFIPMLSRQDFWDALPNLETLAITVSPQYRSIGRCAHKMKDTPVRPSAACDLFYHLLNDYISNIDSLESLEIGWAGSEGDCDVDVTAHTEGWSNILPAPLVPLQETTSAQPQPLVRLPAVRRLKLVRCWTTRRVLGSLISSLAESDLQSLELDKVSLPLFQGSAYLWMSRPQNHHSLGYTNKLRSLLINRRFNDKCWVSLLHDHGFRGSGAEIEHEDEDPGAQERPFNLTLRGCGYVECVAASEHYTARRHNPPTESIDSDNPYADVDERDLIDPGDDPRATYNHRTITRAKDSDPYLGDAKFDAHQTEQKTLSLIFGLRIHRLHDPLRTRPRDRHATGLYDGDPFSFYMTRARWETGQRGRFSGEFH